MCEIRLDSKSEMDQRFDSLHQTMVMGLLGIVGAILAAVVAGVITLV